MPPPSQLSIATSSLNRLVKEESSYHKEHEQQQARISKLESDLQAGNTGEDGNAEFELKQEKQALAETEKMFPALRAKIQDALGKLEGVLEQDKGPGDQSTPEDITKAKEAIAAGLKAVRETS